MTSFPIKTVSLQVEGMHCTNCALGVERTLVKDGFANIHVDFAANEVRLDVSQESDIARAKDLIKSLGYVVADKSAANESKPQGIYGIEK